MGSKGDGNYQFGGSRAMAQNRARIRPDASARRSNDTNGTSSRASHRLAPWWRAP